MERRGFFEVVLGALSCVVAPFFSWLGKKNTQINVGTGDPLDADWPGETVPTVFETPDDCVQLSMTVWRDGNPHTVIAELDIDDPRLYRKAHRKLVDGLMECDIAGSIECQEVVPEETEEE